jgi:Uma2 family endonuclease
MSRSYEEIIEGVSVLRRVPEGRHEEICERLRARISTCLAVTSPARLLEARSVVQISPGTMVRPDLALVTAANGKLLLAVEIVDSNDHRWDTVTKKQIYEDVNIPRLWMIDPRYDNLEVYHASTFGLTLKGILAGGEVLTDKLLPNLNVKVAELFY